MSQKSSETENLRSTIQQTEAQLKKLKNSIKGLQINLQEKTNECEEFQRLELQREEEIKMMKNSVAELNMEKVDWMRDMAHMFDYCHKIEDQNSQQKKKAKEKSAEVEQ